MNVRSSTRAGRGPARRTISPFERHGYYLTRTTSLERDGFVSGALPRVHLVTPAVVERTVARYGVAGILTERGDRVPGYGSIAIRYTVAAAPSR